MEIHETYEPWEARVTNRGKAEGMAEAVLRLLRKRFGSLDPSDTHRVTSADGATLEGMLDRVLTATTLREALG